MSLSAGLRNITAFDALTAAAVLVARAVVVVRSWPVGTPLTPNALNEGQAPFPEFYIVYIDPLSWEHYKKTGQVREGTVLAKEITGVRAPRGPII